MKVLILHQHFNHPRQGGAIRSYYLAKALVDNGVAVTVVTAHNKPKAHFEEVDGIRIHYLPVAYDNSFSFYQRGRSFINYIVRLAQLDRSFFDFDLCYAISVPLTIGIAARWIKFRYHIPYYFEVGDLWPDAPIELDVVKNPLLKQILFQLERSIYRQAAAIVALSTAIKSKVESRAPGKKVYLIPNMSDTDFFQPESKQPALEEQFGVKNRFVVSYIGALGFANGLDYYLECARACQKAGLPVHFLLCGEGAKRGHLLDTKKRLALDNLTILPFENRNGVKEILNVTDATFICYRPVPVLETGSPNKYFDGLAAGKMIVINFGGWIKEEIERSDCGVGIDARQPTSIVEVLRQCLADPALVARRKVNARELAEKKYSRRILSEEFFSNIAEAKINAT